MSTYQNRWASCIHGKRNSRVCVECWEQVQNHICPPTAVDLISDIELVAPGMTEEDKCFLRVDRQPHGFNFLRPLDRRDHEWKPRVRTPTHLNLMTFEEYGEWQ
jgi:hypothetical protein